MKYTLPFFVTEFLALQVLDDVLDLVAQVLGQVAVEHDAVEDADVGVERHEQTGDRVLERALGQGRREIDHHQRRPQALVAHVGVSALFAQQFDGLENGASVLGAALLVQPVDGDVQRCEPVVRLGVEVDPAIGRVEQHVHDELVGLLAGVVQRRLACYRGHSGVGFANVEEGLDEFEVALRKGRINKKVQFS